MKIDLSDVLIVLGSLALLVGLYFVAWPLVLIAAGGAMTAVGLRRS